ncbi:DNA mismatch repair endonuclease MutL [Ruminococcus sp. Marseille-P6503]|uniref:DNA mismatch repair endonuclease MutL n=1 Tax=Ruminococcus sp. Marseille-P6503 TaxID=2364796 RepID=UPI000F528986|nr:DNA mismatch repair endonuclease MutL [Ruminococcus sp. Marseille-P6503]
MSEIKVLSKEVSELIAAGEVIDRPASVIKELLENSIDAGANVITVEIKNGGRTYIRVTDNGSGIAETDISKAFLRHATSKISTKNDLDRIMTLGFRGEALASISAVSRVDVLTKPIDEEYGCHYIIEGGEEKLCEKSGCPDGTTFVVRDIFYNVPARLKFLKKDTSEGNYVANYVTKIALSDPDISFKFIRDNKTELLTAGDGKLYSGIYSVFGREFACSLIPVEYSWNGIRVYGYTVKPLNSKSNRKFQNFFVNGRYVRSKACCEALEEAYRNSIMTGKFPACVLCIDLPPDFIDVNVHPTKMEVRFSDERLVHEAIFFAVKDSLQRQDKPVKIEFDEKRRHFSDSELYRIPEKPQGVQLKFSAPHENTRSAAGLSDDSLNKLPQNFSEESVTVVPPVNDSPLKAEKKTSDDLFLSSLEESGIKETAKPSGDVSDIYDDRKAALPEISDDEIETSDFKYISKSSFEKKNVQSVVTDEEGDDEIIKPIVVGELFKTYIVAQAGEEMLLVDKHAAHERYIFEKIKNDANQLDTQMYIEPIMVLLSYDEYDALASNIEQTAKLGFDIEPDVAPTVAVKGVPIIIGDENPTELVSDLAKNFLACKLNPQLELFDELYHSIACKAAIKANDESSAAELQALVNSIYGRDDIRYCPHGRPVMIKLSKKDIEKQFKRIV